MANCPNCNAAMIQANLYDSEGTIPLYGGLRQWENGELVAWAICINPACDEGKRNISK